MCRQELGQRTDLNTVESAIKDHTQNDLLDQLKEEAMDEMVTAVPVFRPFVNGAERQDRRIMGAQPKEILEEIFSDLGVERVEAS